MRRFTMTKHLGWFMPYDEVVLVIQDGKWIIREPKPSPFGDFNEYGTGLAATGEGRFRLDQVIRLYALKRKNSQTEE